MESSNAETVVEDEVDEPAPVQLIMLETADDADVCSADGMC